MKSERKHDDHRGQAHPAHDDHGIEFLGVRFDQDEVQGVEYGGNENENVSRERVFHGPRVRHDRNVKSSGKSQGNTDGFVFVETGMQDQGR